MPKCIAKQICTVDLCEYGCGEVAKYQFQSGKKCCSPAFQKCKSFIRQHVDVRKQLIDPITGLNPFQKGQKIVAEQRVKNGSYAAAGTKISKTKNLILPDGRRQCDISNANVSKTKLTMGEDGLTNSQRAARKSANTRLADIDEHGLNQYQRWTEERVNNGTFDAGFEKALQITIYPGTELRCQGSYEVKFISKLERNYGLEWVINNVSRGPSIKYVDSTGKSRWYLSDFIIGNTVYEVKSNWTWDRRGADQQLLQNNWAKLQATKDAGFEVVLVREGHEIQLKDIK